MQIFCLCCVCFLLADTFVKTEAQGPTWITSETQSVDASATGFCDFVAVIDANSGDGTDITYSIESQTPEGGFSLKTNAVAFQHELRCNESLIVQPEYTVVVRATQDSGHIADRTITITFTGLTPATPPSCPLTISLTLNTSDSTACNNVITLSCTSSDASSVTYSLQSQSPDGGFSLSGTTLICDQNSLAATTYTVTVRAENTGNSQFTDIVFTITASSSGSDGSGSGSNNNKISTGTIVGAVIGAVVGSAVVGLVVFVIFKVGVCSKKY